MSDMQEVIRVFVASPGDIKEERTLLEDIVSQLNLTFSETIRRRFELVKWETHSRPGKAKYVQDVINRQIPEYDVFLGVMWSRFGTSTPVAESGTEEEFIRACDSSSGGTTVREFLFYFKNQPISPNLIDADQLKKVHVFKANLKPKYGLLYHEYSDIHEFHTKLRLHLSKIIQEWTSDRDSPGQLKEITQTEQHEDDDILEIFNSLDTDTEDDEGLIELMQDSNDSMTRVTEVIRRIVEAMNANTEAVKKHTQNLNEAAALPDRLRMKKAKRIADSVATDFEIFIEVLITEIPNFAKFHSLGMEAFGKTALISKTDFKADPKSVKDILQILKQYRESTNSAYTALTLYKNTTNALPRMTKKFDRSRKRTAALMEDFLNQLQKATIQVVDVEEMFKEIIEYRDDE